MQRVDAHDRGAEAGGELDQRAQVAEVADAPVARRAQAVELHHEAPHPAAFREDLGLMAGAFRDGDLAGGAPRAERLLQRAARRLVDALLALPDVEVAGGNLAHQADSHQLAVQGSRTFASTPQKHFPAGSVSTATACAPQLASSVSPPSQLTSKARSPSMR